MTWSVSFQPLLSQPLMIALAFICAALIVLCALMRMRGVWLRAAAFGLLLLAIANPALEQEDRTPLNSIVALVVDDSQSQHLDGRAAMTRSAADEITKRLQALPGFETRIINVKENANGDGTALFEALRHGLADVPPERVGGAILITDGQVHDIPEAASAVGFSAPVHALITGRENEFDRRLVLERSPRFGLVGSTQTVTLRLEDQGAAPSESDVLITIRRDGDVISEKIVQPSQSFNVPVTIEHGGNNIFEFSAAPLVKDDEKELTEINNHVVVTIDGIRENLRVLLVSGTPHAGERTWRNLLKSDASVDLVHFTILRPPEKQDGTPINQLSLIAFPTRELFSTKIDEFDLIIFDRYERRGVLPMLYFDNIARYVQNGGAVLVAGGPDYAGDNSLFYSPLAAVLPSQPTGGVYEEPYRPAITDIGARHPVTRNLPGSGGDPAQWSKWFRLIDSASRGGEVIMSGPDDKPLLVLERQGKGRVAVLLSDHAWLWARGYDGGGPHVTLLRRLAHWLMKEPDLDEEALRIMTQADQLVIERQTLGDAPGEVTLAGPTGEARPLTMIEEAPGLWRARVPAQGFGLYTANDGARKALIHVGPSNLKEFSDVLSTPDLLRSLSQETGGDVRRIADADGEFQLMQLTPQRRAAQYHGAGRLGLRVSDVSQLNGVVRLPLFSGLIGLALLLGALSLSWYREGRS